MATDASFSVLTPVHDEGIAIVVGQESIGVDDCDEPDGEVDYVPLNTVRPESMEGEQIKRRGGRFKERAQRTETYKRKRGRPAGMGGPRGDSWILGPPLPAGSKSAKGKTGQKLALAHRICSDSEGERDNDDDFAPKVPVADGRKKYTRVQGRRGPAFRSASEVQEIPGEYPSFTKCMVPSNVLRVFWLHLSSDFCRKYLPKQNDLMTLEDEDGQRDYVNYISGSHGLSGGWRRFATDHSLKVGDTVVFELVRPKKFKVYIRRENESKTTDDDVRSMEVTEVTGASSSAPDDVANNLASEEAVDNVDVMRSPDSDIKDFDGVPSFKNFNTFIDGFLTNPELFPDHLRETYYALCCGRKALLHRHLPKKINPALVIGLIMETTNIAKGISAASSREDLAAWKKILEAFELLGMDVGFLRKRVDDLLGVFTAQPSTDQQPLMERSGYEDVKLEKDHAAEKMRALKSNMATLKDALKAMDVKMEEMESSVKKTAQAMQQMANAPW